MKNYWIFWQYLRRFARILLISIVAIFANQALAKPVVIGYIPAFRAMAATIDSTDLTLVTHINISFLNPDINGVLIKNDVIPCMPNAVGGNTTASDLRYVINKAHQANVKVLVSVAGGVIPSCSGDWNSLLHTVNRKTFVDSLIKFVDDFELDGLDIDLEGDVLTKIDRAGDYTPFVQALSEQLKARNKLLTCATASYEGGMIPVASISYFDYVNIMSYDTIGPSWGTPGVEHSTYAQAVTDLTLWKNRGVAQEKLVLGVPFYGYGFGTYAANYSFKEILEKLGIENSDKDLIGSACAGCNYVTYNGLATIKKKSQLALQNAAGIMIWELSQDAPGNASLLKAINTELQITAASSSAASSTFSSAIAVNDASQTTKKSGGAFSLASLWLLIAIGIVLSLSVRSKYFRKKLPSATFGS